MTRTAAKMRCTVDPSSIHMLHDAIDRCLMPDGEGEEWLSDLHVILDEMASNIEKYAYPEGNGVYDVSIIVGDDHVELVFEDSGIEFDPLEVEEEPLNCESDRPVGRLGILLVKALSQSVGYERSGSVNRTRIVVPLLAKENKP
jgi:anti-sigma regulatory factor (Ser/Thr protein kinase)